MLTYLHPFFFFAILRVFVVSGVAQLSHDPEVVPSLRSLLPRIRIKMAKKRCFCFLIFFFLLIFLFFRARLKMTKINVFSFFLLSSNFLIF